METDGGSAAALDHTLLEESTGRKGVSRVRLKRRMSNERRDFLVSTAYNYLDEGRNFSDRKKNEIGDGDGPDVSNTFDEPQSHSSLSPTFGGGGGGGAGGFGGVAPYRVLGSSVSGQRLGRHVASIATYVTSRRRVYLPLLIFGLWFGREFIWDQLLDLPLPFAPVGSSSVSEGAHDSYSAGAALVGADDDDSNPRGRTTDRFVPMPMKELLVGVPRGPPPSPRGPRRLRGATPISRGGGRKNPLL